MTYGIYRVARSRNGLREIDFWDFFFKNLFRFLQDIGPKGHSMPNHPMVETVPPQILIKIYTFGLYGQKRRFAK